MANLSQSSQQLNHKTSAGSSGGGSRRTAKTSADLFLFNDDVIDPIGTMLIGQKPIQTEEPEPKKPWKDKYATGSLSTTASYQNCNNQMQQSTGSHRQNCVLVYSNSNCNRSSNSDSFKLSSLRGKKWTTMFELASKNSNLDEDDIGRQTNSKVMRLNRDDMGLFGLCPETDKFFAVLCQDCGAPVKPQALRRHIEHRHHKGGKAGEQQHLRHFSYDDVSNMTMVAATVSSSFTLYPPPYNNVADRAGLVLSASSRPLPVPAATCSPKLHDRDRPEQQIQQPKSEKDGRRKSKSLPPPSSSSSSAISTATTTSASQPAASTKSTDSSSSQNSLSSSASSSGKENQVANFHAAVFEDGSSSHTSATGSSNTSKRDKTCPPSPLPPNFSSSCSSYSSSSSSHSSSNSSFSSSSSSSSTLSSSSNSLDTFSNNNSPLPVALDLNLSIDSVKTASPIKSTSTSKNQLSDPTKSESQNHRLRRRHHNHDYDPDKHCGVLDESERPCLQSLGCKEHTTSQRRLVEGRSSSFENLLNKKNRSKRKRDSNQLTLELDLQKTIEKHRQEVPHKLETKLQKLKEIYNESKDTMCSKALADVLDKYKHAWKKSKYYEHDVELPLPLQELMKQKQADDLVQEQDFRDNKAKTDHEKETAALENCFADELDSKLLQKLTKHEKVDELQQKQNYNQNKETPNEDFFNNFSKYIGPIENPEFNKQLYADSASKIGLQTVEEQEILMESDLVNGLESYMKASKSFKNPEDNAEQEGEPEVDDEREQEEESVPDDSCYNKISVIPSKIPQYVIPFDDCTSYGFSESIPRQKVKKLVLDESRKKTSIVGEVALVNDVTLDSKKEFYNEEEELFDQFLSYSDNKKTELSNYESDIEQENAGNSRVSCMTQIKDEDTKTTEVINYNSNCVNVDDAVVYDENLTLLVSSSNDEDSLMEDFLTEKIDIKDLKLLKPINGTNKDSSEKTHCIYHSDCVKGGSLSRMEFGSVKPSIWYNSVPTPLAINNFQMRNAGGSGGFILNSQRKIIDLRRSLNQDTNYSNAKSQSLHKRLQIFNTRRSRLALPPPHQNGLFVSNNHIESGTNNFIIVNNTSDVTVNNILGNHINENIIIMSNVGINSGYHRHHHRHHPDDVLHRPYLHHNNHNHSSGNNYNSNNIELLITNANETLLDAGNSSSNPMNINNMNLNSCGSSNGGEDNSNDDDSKTEIHCTTNANLIIPDNLLDQYQRAFGLDQSVEADLEL